MSQLFARRTLDCRLPKLGGDSMSAEHLRFIQKLYWLMQECGIPEKNPGVGLFAELYQMIEDHCEYTGVDLE
jgi:hypothetical protein